MNIKELNNKTVTELKVIAKENNIKGYSKLNKNKLIELILENVHIESETLTLYDFKTTKEISDFAKRCLENNWHGGKTYMKIWKESKNLKDFKQRVLQNEEVKLLQGTAELMKNDVDNWRYLRSILGDKQFKTSSDAGGVKIGNENFEIIIPNGVGDGITRVAVLNKNEMNDSAFDYITFCKGKINIYNYDCGCEIAKTIEGRYGIYSKDGFVVFEKWN